jgi:hypothetical protein
MVLIAPKIQSNGLKIPGQHYAPQGSADVAVFQAGYCSRCKNNDDVKSCFIKTQADTWPVTDSRYPKEWTYDKRGRPTCIEFINAKPAPTDQPKTNDLFK